MNPVEDLLAKYGGRAYYVLKAALEVAEENRRLGLSRLGDFDYRSLTLKLKAWGIEYNPSNLLKVMEREYGIVKTTYRSSNQRWWSFAVDVTSVRLSLEEGKDETMDPEEELLYIQVTVLDVDRVIAELASILSKERVTAYDERRLKDIVLNELPQIVEVYKRAVNYGGKFSDFVGKVRKALELARKAALLTRGLARVPADGVPGGGFESALAATPSKAR